MAAPTNEQREKDLDLVEDLMLRGFERPAVIARNLSTNERTVDQRTATRYIKTIRERWQRRASESQRTDLRFELIEQAREVGRRAWALYSAAMNGSGSKTGTMNLNAAAGALRSVVTAQERIAKLQGLDLDKVEHSISEATIEALRKAAIEESMGELGEDPIRTLRGAVPSDSRQGGADSSAHSESPSTTHEGDQTPSD